MVKSSQYPFKWSSSSVSSSWEYMTLQTLYASSPPLPVHTQVFSTIDSKPAFQLVKHNQGPLSTTALDCRGKINVDTDILGQEPWLVKPFFKWIARASKWPSPASSPPLSPTTTITTAAVAPLVKPIRCLWYIRNKITAFLLFFPLSACSLRKSVLFDLSNYSRIFKTSSSFVFFVWSNQNST